MGVISTKANESADTNDVQTRLSGGIDLRPTVR